MNSIKLTECDNKQHCNKQQQQPSSKSEGEKNFSWVQKLTGDRAGVLSGASQCFDFIK